jgi:hypothetical protein
MTDTPVTAEQVAAAGITLAPGQNPDGSVAATPAAVAAPAERPAGLPAKFNTWEDMAKSYAALEAKLGTPKPALVNPATGQPAVTEPTPEVAPEVTVDAGQVAAQAAGIDMDAYTAKYAAQGGKLTDADYTELAAKGLSKSTVDTYIAGQAALTSQRADSLYQTLGDTVETGKARFNELAAWLGSPEGAAAVPAAHIDAANKALAGTDVAAASVVLQGLLAKFQAAEGASPNLLASTNTPGVGAQDIYASFTEQVAAQSDPRYATDEAFRKAVHAKIARSTGY